MKNIDMLLNTHITTSELIGSLFKNLSDYELFDFITRINERRGDYDFTLRLKNYFELEIKKEDFYNL